MQQQTDSLAQDLERVARSIVLWLFVLSVVFVLFEALRGAEFWNKMKGEGNLWNYGSSLIYFTAGQMAIVNAILLRYRQRTDGGSRSLLGPSLWMLAGIAFVFFACDEMLEVHEKLGLALEQVVPWISQAYPGHADNLIMGVYGVGGVIFAAVYLGRMRPGRGPTGFFVAGGVMIGLAIMLDVIPREVYIEHLPFRETEELLELYAGFSFMSSFLLSAADAASRILAARDWTEPATLNAAEVNINAGQ